MNQEGTSEDPAAPSSEKPASSSSSPENSSRRRIPTRMERRATIPIELEDPEDMCVGDAEADLFPLYEEDYDEEERIIRQRDDHHEEESFWSSSLHEQLVQLPKEVRNILAGGTAGMIAKSVVAPLDRIKILYQVSAAQFHIFNLHTVVRNIVHHEGFSALWKGNTATLLRVFPYSGIQFMVFDRCKQHFLKEHDDDRNDVETTTDERRGLLENNKNNHEQHDRKWGLTPMESLVSGMIAGTVSVICTYPLDLTRVQLAVLDRTKNHQGFAGIIADNYRNRGVLGLFRGMGPTLLGILPYSGIAFALNEQGKREIEHITGREVTTVERMQCGAFSGLVAQTVTYPIEVTRRRMQTIGLVGTHNDSALTSLGCSSQRPVVATPPTLLATVKNLYVEQGVRGFLKGVSMNWMKGPVAFSISFTTFDHVQKYMESPAERAKRLPKRFLSSPTTIRRDT